MTSGSTRWPKRVGIRDVSRESGVSVGTVSNVINSPDLVAKKTRDRVLAAIEKLGYERQSAALALTARRSFMIGYPLFSSGAGASIMGEFFRQLVVRAGDHGLGVTTLVASTESEMVEVFRQAVVAGSVDGFLLAEVVEDDPRVRWLLDHDVPFATFGRSGIPEHDCWIDLDLHTAMTDVVDLLVAKGHRNFGYIGWEGQPTNRFRLEGFLQGTERHGIVVDPETIIEAPFSAQGGERAAARLLERAVRPTAIVCAQDVLAAGAVRACRAVGLRVGVDIAVTGFDDTSIARATDPPLTSVAFPLKDVADQIVEMLVERIEGRTSGPGELLSPHIVLRESSGHHR